MSASKREVLNEKSYVRYVSKAETMTAETMSFYRHIQGLYVLLAAVASHYNLMHAAATSSLPIVRSALAPHPPQGPLEVLCTSKCFVRRLSRKLTGESCPPGFPNFTSRYLIWINLTVTM